ncbi:MAG: Ycf66 family protein [Pleurocapsa sp.]
MLSYVLAIAVATSSLVLFSTAFLMSDIHRKDDFLWSGVGLLYAVILWYCAHNITGAVLLGQAAATVLLVSASWQTINLRKAIANPAKAAEISNFSVVQSIKDLLKRNKSQVQPLATPAKTPSTPKITEQEIAIPDTASESEQTVAEIPKKTPTTTDSNALIDIDQKPIKNEPAVVKDANDFVSKPTAQTTPTTTDRSDDQTARETQPPNPQLSQPSEVAKTEQTKQTKPETVQNNQTNQSPDTVENTETNSAWPSEPEVKIKDSFDNQPPANKPKLDIRPVPEKISTEIPKSANTKTSSFDSLEIVEVAEVLEAISEDTSVNRESDQSNIIEVTTTEISITSEVKKIDRNQNENSEFSDELKEE